MNKWTLLLVLIGLGVFGALNRDKIAAYLGQKPSQESEASATVAPITPNPATDSIGKARQKYPALAVANSTFNKKFLELYNAKKESEPAFLAAADWPMKLADQAAGALNGPAPTYQAPTEVSGSSLNDRPNNFAGPTRAPAVQLPGLKGSALDQRPPSSKGH